MFRRTIVNALPSLTGKELKPSVSGAACGELARGGFLSRSGCQQDCRGVRWHQFHSRQAELEFKIGLAGAATKAKFPWLVNTVYKILCRHCLPLYFVPERPIVS